MAEDKWSQNGITFRIATMDDFKEVKNFLKNYFFPDEPVCRGSKLIEMDATGVVNKYLNGLIEKFMIKEGLEKPTSMIAMKDGEMVGCR